MVAKESDREVLEKIGSGQKFVINSGDVQVI